MPFFRVMLHGEGINVPYADDPTSAPIIGFYATRMVIASSTDKAVEKAKAVVLADWTSGRYAEGNQGTQPVLTVESVERTNLLQRLKFKNKGYVFYENNDED